VLRDNRSVSGEDICELTVSSTRDKKDVQDLSVGSDDLHARIAYFRCRI
jgi:hypothetical protein